MAEFRRYKKGMAGNEIREVTGRVVISAEVTGRGTFFDFFAGYWKFTEITDNEDGTISGKIERAIPPQQS